ncbi:MAG: hypothetical protein GY850_10390 [bacterium]|nr:hypothetical protein [bacterium]
MCRCRRVDIVENANRTLREPEALEAKHPLCTDVATPAARGFPKRRWAVDRGDSRGPRGHPIGGEGRTLMGAEILGYE